MRLISANAKNCCQTVTGFLPFCSRLFAPRVLDFLWNESDKNRHGRERQIGMERFQRVAREKQWNSHVREAVQAGTKHRVYRVLTAAVWVLLFSAVGLMAYWVYTQHSQLEFLRRVQEDAQVRAAQERVREEALKAQADRLAADNSDLQARLDAAELEAEEVRQALAEAQAEIGARREESQNQPPKVVGPAYTALYPELYATSSRRETLAPDYTVYLTFDDGPSLRTAEILDILKENDIKATFFVTGQTSDLAQELMRRIVAEGHTIAVHTYTHKYEEVYASVEAYLADFDRIYNWVHEVTGVYPQIFRFPGGTINSYNQTLYRELVAEMDRRGFVHHDWNAMCGDADGKPHTPEELAANSLAMLGAKRAIILMHDSAVRENTVACLPAVIAGYRNAGYAFAPLTPEVKAITFDK